MPDEAVWRTFFATDCVVERMDCAPTGQESVLEFGCGYGTFTLPVARRTRGVVHALDIDVDRVNELRERARAEGLMNLRVTERDFLENGTGLPAACVDHAMIYNLLHIEQPLSLLSEAWRVLRPGGGLSVIHWNHDPRTPRGPPLDIRPRPGQCRGWAEAVGFMWVDSPVLGACAPHHYGLVFNKSS